MEECPQVDHLLTDFPSNSHQNSNRATEPPPPPENRRRLSPAAEVETAPPCEDDRIDRRILRSRYHAIRTVIEEQQEELFKANSDRLLELIVEIDYLYRHVEELSDQVTDAETFLEIAKTFLAKVQSYCNSDISPSEFIASLIHEYGQVHSRTQMIKSRVSIKWKEIGMLVSSIFNKGHGCSTMMGPMKVEFKQRARSAAQRRPRKSNGVTVMPKQVRDAGVEATATDTDKNIATIFNILRKERSVRLENLILNRLSFSQTTENLFALSFLVKDGRAKITVDDKGTHRVIPKNAPTSNLVASGKIVYTQFVFKLDFKDWQLMVKTVGRGEELMPHRYQVAIPLSEAEKAEKLSEEVTVAVLATSLSKTEEE